MDAKFRGRVPEPCECCVISDECLPGANSKAVRHCLDRMAQPAIIEHGEHLYRADEAFQGFYIIRSGAIKTYQRNRQNGRNFKERIWGFFLTGDVIGMDGLEDGRYPSNAVAIDTCAICWIPYRQYLEAIQTYPELSVELLRMSLRSARKHALGTSSQRADARIAQFLIGILQQLNAHGWSSHAVRLPMKRADIGNYLGIASETVSRIFNAFEINKVIAVDGRNVRVLDPNQLTITAGLTQVANEGLEQMAWL